MLNSTGLVLGGLTLALGLMAGTSTAAEKAAPPTIEDLAWLEGDWVGEYVLPEGMPEVGPAGAKVVSYNFWKRVLGGKFLSLRIRDEIDGKVVSTGEEYVGTHHGTNVLAHWFLGSTGAHGEGQWHRNGDMWELKWSAYDAHGRRIEAVGAYIPLDADSHTWQIKDITVDGKELPDWPKVTYRRKKGASSGELWTAYRDAISGTWIGTGELIADDPAHKLAQGDRFQYRLCFTPVLNGNAFAIEGEISVPAKSYSAQVHATGGWDPENGQVRLLLFRSDGSVEDVTLSRQEGRSFFGMYHGRNPGLTSFRGPTRADFQDDDTLVYRMLDGTVLSTWKREK